jgi:fatty-acyl-CoA synthase
VTNPTTLLQRIGEAALAFPDRASLILGDATLTHEEVDRLSALVARGLIGSGVARGDRVAVVSPNHLLTMVATMGILRAEATWIPLNPRDSVDTIAELCGRFGTNVVIYHHDFVDAVTSIRSTAATVTRTLPLDDLLLWATAHDQAAVLTEPPPDALAAIFATGGTTGIPKGVCFSYGTLSAIVGNYVDLLDHPDPVFLAAGPLTHVSGRACLGIMAAGGTTVVLPRFDAGAALAAIERHRVTTMVLPTTMLTRFVAHPAAASTDTSSLCRVSVGASPVPIDVLKRAITTFGPVIAQNYGQTEAPMHISSMQPDEYLVDGQFVDDARLASCGRATRFCEIRIVGADTVELPSGEVGEIVVRSNFVMDGYLDDEAGTLATRIDGYHRTGDLGTLDPDGYLTIVGRLRQMVITGGFNVYPAEIEGVLAERPEVYESAVIGLPDPDWGERLVAIIELNEGAQYDPEELRQYIHTRLGGVKTPKQFVVVDELPRNANGKILKNILVDRLRPGTRGGAGSGRR